MAKLVASAVSLTLLGLGLIAAAILLVVSARTGDERTGHAILAAGLCVPAGACLLGSTALTITQVLLKR